MSMKIKMSPDSLKSMFPIGVLFGPGFDTATEILIVGITVSASISGHDAP